jgi:hypothetical protein
VPSAPASTAWRILSQSRHKSNNTRAPDNYQAAYVRYPGSWLTEKGILVMNPVPEVKTEKFSRTEGKTTAKLQTMSNPSLLFGKQRSLKPSRSLGNEKAFIRIG